MTKCDWIKKATSVKGEKGKPRGKGTLTKQAQNAKKSVRAFAQEVVDNPHKYDKITRQRVNLYQNITGALLE